MILCLYVEVRPRLGWLESPASVSSVQIADVLESLTDLGCGVYDATSSDPYTAIGSMFHTLDEIEVDLEGK